MNDKERADQNLETALKAVEGLAELENRIENVLLYCEPHLETMWAAFIVGTLLKCDFRDAKAELKKRLQRLVTNEK